LNFDPPHKNRRVRLVVQTREVDLAQELGAGKYIKKPYTLGKVGLAVKEELEK